MIVPFYSCNQNVPESKYFDWSSCCFDILISDINNFKYQRFSIVKVLYIEEVIKLHRYFILFKHTRKYYYIIKLEYKKEYLQFPAFYLL